jgi:Tfp pilus assembly protein PilO
MAPLTRVLADKRLVVVPLAVLALANLVMLGLVLGPLGARVRTLEARAAAATQGAAAAQRDLEQARALASGKSQATTDLQTFYNEVLPADQAGARRVTFLRMAQVARDAGLDFDRRAFAQEQPRGANLVRVDLSMVVTGRYSQLRRFFHAVESGPDFVVIRSVNVGQAGDTPGELEATLELSTYYYRASDGG